MPPEMSRTAHQTAENVRAFCSLTLIPALDCAPARFQREGFHAFSSVMERFLIRFATALSARFRSLAVET
jgi:hypothetical protein